MQDFTHYSIEAIENREDVREETYQEQGVWNKPINHKKQIQFRNPSFIRRNIDKALVRSLAKSMVEVEGEIKDEFKNCGIKETEYEKIVLSIHKVNELEKKSNYKKDYAKTINHMMQSRSRQIVFRKCLEKKKRDIDTITTQKVRGNNLKIYRETLEDMINYLGNLYKNN